MNLKTCKTVTRMLYVVCIVLVLCAFTAGVGTTLYYGSLGAAIAAALTLGIFRVKFWRCPRCKAMLPNSGPIRCANCKWTLPDVKTTL